MDPYMWEMQSNIREHERNVRLSLWQALNTQLSHDSLPFNVLIYFICSFYVFTFLEVRQYTLVRFFFFFFFNITCMVLKSLFWLILAMALSFFMSSVLALLLPYMCSTLLLACVYLCSGSRNHSRTIPVEAENPVTQGVARI